MSFAKNKTKRKETKNNNNNKHNDSIRAQTPTAVLFENFFIAKILFSVDLKMRLNFAKIMSIPNFSDIYALNVYLQALVLRAPHLFFTHPLPPCHLTKHVI